MSSWEEYWKVRVLEGVSLIESRDMWMLGRRVAVGIRWLSGLD